MRGSLRDGQAPSEEWVAHRDDAIKLACSIAVGRERMLELATEVEKGGLLVGAARLLIATAQLHRVGLITISEVFNSIPGYRARTHSHTCTRVCRRT